MAELRNRPQTAERRTVDVDVRDVETRGNTLHGYALIYNSESADLGGFRERFAPGAFRDVVKTADVRALLNHDRNIVLGRTKSGTLRLEDDDKGVHFEIDLPDTEQGRAVRTAVERRDIDGASFDFTAALDSWQGDLRTIERVAELRDISLATEPAYPSSSVELRTRPRTDPAPDGPSAPMLTVRNRDQRPEQRTRDIDIDQLLCDQIREVEKGEQRTIEMRTLSTAVSISPPEMSTRLFDRLRPNSVVLRSGVTVLPIENDSVTYPRLSADASPAWYAEGATITPGDPTLTSDTIVPQKVAHLVELTNEVIDDSEPSVLDVVRNHLLAVLGLKIDIGLLEGNGTPPNPLGFRSVSGIQTISTLGANGSTPTNLDAWTDAVNALEGVNAAAVACFMHSRTSGTLRKLKKGPTGNIEPLLQGSASQMLRAPLGIGNAVTNQLSITETQGTSSDCSSSYVIDTARVYVVRRLDVAIEVDRSRLFNADKSEIRAKARVNLYVPEGAAIARIVGIRAV